MTQTIHRQLTVAEFAQLPNPPGQRMELVDGRVVIMAPVGAEHGEEAGYLAYHLVGFVKQQAAGKVRVETGYRLPVSDATVRAPDVSFVSSARVLAEKQVEGFIDGFPDLAVEIMSPGDLESEVAAKVREYLASGVQRVWVVRPRLANVTVHRPGGDSHTYEYTDRLTSDDASFAVDGFSLPLSEIFEKPESRSD